MGFYHPAIFSRKHRYNYIQKHVLSQDKNLSTKLSTIPEIQVEKYVDNHVIKVDNSQKSIKIRANPVVKLSTGLFLR